MGSLSCHELSASPSPTWRGPSHNDIVTERVVRRLQATLTRGAVRSTTARRTRRRAAFGPTHSATGLLAGRAAVQLGFSWVNVNAKAHHGCWQAFVQPTAPIPHVLTDITTLCQHHQTVTPAPKRNLPLKSYPMEPDLIAGLARLSRREHLPVSALVRRAIRRELEREGVLVPRALPPALESEAGRRTRNARAGRPRARTRTRP